MVEATAANQAYVKTLTEPTSSFLCKLSDNEFHIKFGAFRIRDMVSKQVLVDVRESDLDSNVSDAMDPKTRLLKYHFGPDFLEL